MKCDPKHRLAFFLEDERSTCRYRVRTIKICMDFDQVIAYLSLAPKGDKDSDCTTS